MQKLQSYAQVPSKSGRDKRDDDRYPRNRDTVFERREISISRNEMSYDRGREERDRERYFIQRLWVNM